jgi:hypothetical protein
LTAVTTQQRRNRGTVYSSLAIRRAQPLDPWEAAPLFTGYTTTFDAVRHPARTRGN